MHLVGLQKRTSHSEVVVHLNDIVHTLFHPMTTLGAILK